MSDSYTNTLSQPECSTCSSTGWVCENHHDKPWAGGMPDGFKKCCGGAGMPCIKCNPSDYDNPPRELAGSKIIFDRNGWRH